jgi:hypothetical protein
MSLRTYAADGRERCVWGDPHTDKAKADEIASILRSQGRNTRVYPRTVSAEGMSFRVYVIVTDLPPVSP